MRSLYVSGEDEEDSVVPKEVALPLWNRSWAWRESLSLWVSRGDS